MGQDYHLNTDHLSSSHKKWLSASGKQCWEWHVTAIKLFDNAEMYHIIILSSVINCSYGISYVTKVLQISGRWVDRNNNNKNVKSQACLFLPVHFHYNELISGRRKLVEWSITFEECQYGLCFYFHCTKEQEPSVKVQTALGEKQYS